MVFPRHKHMVKKLGLVLHCLVGPPSGSWSTSLDACGFAQAKRTCLAPSAHEISHSLPCSRATPGELQLPSNYVMDVLKNCGFADVCNNCVRVLRRTQKKPPKHKQWRDSAENTQSDGVRHNQHE